MIETNAEELRQSNSLAESFAQLLRRRFNGVWDSEEGDGEEKLNENT